MLSRLTGKAGPLVLQRYPGGLYLKTARAKPSYATPAQNAYRAELSMLRHWWYNLPPQIREYNRLHPYTPATNYYDRWLHTTRHEIAATQIPSLTPHPEFVTGPQGFHIPNTGQPDYEYAHWVTTGETANRRICLMIGWCDAQYAYPRRLRVQGMDMWPMTRGYATWTGLVPNHWFLGLAFVHDTNNNRYSKAVGGWFLNET